MGQIKLTVATNFKKNIELRAKKIGVKPTQYIMSLIIQDINNEMKRGQNA